MDKGTIRSYTTNDDRGGKQMQSVSAIDYDWLIQNKTIYEYDIRSLILAFMLGEDRIDGSR